MSTNYEDGRVNTTMCSWCGDKYEARAWDAQHNCKEEE